MDKIYIDEIYSRLESELSEVDPFPDLFSNALGIVSSYMHLLHGHILESGFADEGEEIYFFKHVKPRFYHWYIFLVERHTISKGLAIGTEHMARDYYLQELSFIKRYFDQNGFIYHYFLEGETSRDADFFLRSFFQPALDSPGAVFPNFSTNHDYTFSKILAYEKLQEFLVIRLRATYATDVSTILGELRSGRKRTWTDEKIKLVELAYGIYFMNSVDFGKADITDIISALEDAFNVHLGVVYRRFVEISRRKSTSHTSYLDAMRAEIVRRITEKDRYKPFGPKKKTDGDPDKNR
ncbi:RteC domain-containing protein [Pedobacter paludis]|uniref:Tetracycline regulation of excision, RteC n=1 Tax=Pedobacter paludis TaxID=2203212 RepID=A0A317F2Y3_9SPHI|nr:RteC domain-containing protein [Pedobacter paludis]PWS32653.1 hypothetical protein DF947_06165 [Pedobacter paludis]